jgi:hypothetical protein
MDRRSRNAGACYASKTGSVNMKNASMYLPRHSNSKMNWRRPLELALVYFIALAIVGLAGFGLWTLVARALDLN